MTARSLDALLRQRADLIQKITAGLGDATRRVAALEEALHGQVNLTTLRERLTSGKEAEKCSS
jgi:hypothetical protein